MKKHLLILISLSIITQSKAQKPVANFFASDDTICSYDCITFSDSSTNNPTSWLWTFSGALPSTTTDPNPWACYDSAGRFDVKLVVSNSFGSDSITKSNLILVSPAPPVPNMTIYGDTLFCSTDTSYAYYQWYDSTTAIPGATDTFLVINHSGNYNVRVTNIYCCSVAVGPVITLCESYKWNNRNGGASPPSNHSEARLTTSYGTYFLSGNAPCGMTVSVKNYIENNVVNLFPNPATNQLTIQASSLYAGEEVTVSIMNVLGQGTSPPTPLQLDSGAAAIDVSALAAGLYFVRVSDDKQSWTARFIKE